MTKLNFLSFFLDFPLHGPSPGALMTSFFDDEILEARLRGSPRQLEKIKESPLPRLLPPPPRSAPTSRSRRSAMCLSRTASEQRLAEQMKQKVIRTPTVQKTPLQEDIPREQPKRRPVHDQPKPKEDLANLLSLEPEPEEVSAKDGCRALLHPFGRRSGRTKAVMPLDEPPSSRESCHLIPCSPNPFVALSSPRSQAADEVPLLRWREFALIYVAYMGFLLSRKNYGFWLRSVISELGHEKGQAGLLGSTLEVTYGTCSFLNGVVIDSRSPKNLLIAGLLLSALLNLSVASTENLPLMIFLWGLNGAVQSVGWPSVTNIFLAWFPDPSSRGAWYSLLSTCQNAGAALVPLLVSASVSTYGWRAALYAPAVASVGVAVLLGGLLFGSPDAVASHKDGLGTPIVKAKAKPADLANTMREQVSRPPRDACRDRALISRRVSSAHAPRSLLPRPSYAFALRSAVACLLSFGAR